jgi:hypothetical protein
MDSYTIILGDFDFILTIKDSTRQTSKETADLSNMVSQLDLTDIDGALYTAAECTFSQGT